MKGKYGLFAICRSDATNDTIFRHRIGGMDPAPLLKNNKVCKALVQTTLVRSAECNAERARRAKVESLKSPATRVARKEKTHR